MMARLRQLLQLEISLEFHSRFQELLGVVSDGNRVGGSTSMDFHILGSSQGVIAFHSVHLHSTINCGLLGWGGPPSAAI